MGKKKRKYLLRNGSNTNYQNENIIYQFLDEKTKKLIKENQNKLQNDKFTVYCSDLKKVLHFEVHGMKQRIVYHGGQDPNGYAQGQLVEEIYADVDPKNGIISEESPLGKKLLKSKVGDKITIEIKENQLIEYIVLHTASIKYR